MNNGQAFESLLKIQRTSPEHTDAAEALMQYVTELAAAAALAASNLRQAAMGHNENTAHNARVIDGMLDKLILKSPSHGGDI